MQSNQQLNRPKIIYRASPGERLVAAIVCLAIVGFFVLSWFVAHYNIDTGWWLGYCGFKQKYGLPCPACGMTTSVLAFSQGRIVQAFYIQPAAAFLCSIMVLAASLAFLIAVFGVYFVFLRRFFAEVKARHIILALIVTILAGWAVTLARALAARS